MIYVLEDDDSIRELVIYSLIKTGSEARGFATPSAFYRALSENTPELVLLDVMLPEEDGLSVLKRLRRDKTTKDIPAKQLILTTETISAPTIPPILLSSDFGLPPPLRST